jgi:hypothetical protein
MIPVEGEVGDRNIVANPASMVWETGLEKLNVNRNVKCNAFKASNSTRRYNMGLRMRYD